MDQQLKKYLQHFRYYYINQLELSRKKPERQNKLAERQRNLKYREEPGAWDPRTSLHSNRPPPSNRSSPPVRQDLRRSSLDPYHATPGSTQTLQRQHHARTHSPRPTTQTLSSSTEQINALPLESPQVMPQTRSPQVDTRSQTEQGSRGYKNNRFNKQRAYSIDQSATTGLNYSLYSSGKLTKDANMHGRVHHSPAGPYNQPRPTEKFRQSDKSGSDRSLSGRHSLSSTPERLYSGDIPPPVTIYRTSSRTSVHSTSSRSSMERNGNEDHSYAGGGLPHHIVSMDKHSSLSDLSRTVDLSDIASDQFSHHIEDLNERMSHLVAVMSDEKTELIQKLRLEGKE